MVGIASTLIAACLVLLFRDAPATVAAEAPQASDRAASGQDRSMA